MTRFRTDTRIKHQPTKDEILILGGLFGEVPTFAGFMWVPRYRIRSPLRSVRVSLKSRLSAAARLVPLCATSTHASIVANATASVRAMGQNFS